MPFISSEDFIKIYTKTGDDGSTCVIGGKRVLKSLPLLEVIGDLDELNGWLGLVNRPSLQALVMDMSAILAGSGKVTLENDTLTNLETRIDEISATVPELDSFIMPTGKVQSEYFMARAVCRRAERHLVALGEEQFEFAHILKCLNRLSDYLFMLGYAENTSANRW